MWKPIKVTLGVLGGLIIGSAVVGCIVGCSASVNNGSTTTTISTTTDSKTKPTTNTTSNYYGTVTCDGTQLNPYPTMYVTSKNSVTIKDSLTDGDKPGYYWSYTIIDNFNNQTLPVHLIPTYTQTSDVFNNIQNNEQLIIWPTLLDGVYDSTIYYVINVIN